METNRLTARRCNGIKEGYWSMAHKDELVQRLGQYEDICPNPADLRSLLKRYQEQHEADLKARQSAK